MKLTDIPSPGFLTNSPRLRSEAVTAINYTVTQALLTKGASESGKDLRDFFLACAKTVEKETNLKKEAKK